MPRRHPHRTLRLQLPQRHHPHARRGARVVHRPPVRRGARIRRPGSTGKHAHAGGVPSGHADGGGDQRSALLLPRPGAKRDPPLPRRHDTVHDQLQSGRLRLSDGRDLLPRREAAGAEQFHGVLLPQGHLDRPGRAQGRRAGQPLHRVQRWRACGLPGGEAPGAGGGVGRGGQSGVCRAGVPHAGAAERAADHHDGDSRPRGCAQWPPHRTHNLAASPHTYPRKSGRPRDTVTLCLSRRI
mmetsp:Transcript_1283/g.3035  ORF Transcript_1283/g.3035 Transcript_1283/m.3035 type:complete len:240 (-) Transcript_1283:176-895(-)